MALGFEKLNTSGARSGRSNRTIEPAKVNMEKFWRYSPGETVSHPTFGEGEVVTASDSPDGHCVIRFADPVGDRTIMQSWIETWNPRG